MADERTVAPSAARQRRAWRAGRRPRSRWLLSAAACGLLAAGLSAGVEAGPGVSPGAVMPARWLHEVAVWLALGWLLGLALALGVGLSTGQVGPVAGGRERLDAPAPRPPVLLGLLIVLGLGLGLGAELVGVVAGAARAVDASEAGLVALWRGWAAQGLAVLGLGLGLAGLFELVLERRAHRFSLWQTPQQARDEARASGRARR